MGDRQTDSQTASQTDRETERERERQRERETETVKDRETETDKERQRQREMEREKHGHSSGSKIEPQLQNSSETPMRTCCRQSKSYNSTIRLEVKGKSCNAVRKRSLTAGYLQRSGYWRVPDPKRSNING